MKYVVAFDISNGKRRKAVAKACEEQGFRVQKSVFEIFMQSSGIRDFSERLLALIDPEQDTIRLYPLDSDNDRNTLIVGRGKPVRQVLFAIV